MKVANTSTVIATAYFFVSVSHLFHLWRHHLSELSIRNQWNAIFRSLWELLKQIVMQFSNAYLQQQLWYLVNYWWISFVFHGNVIIYDGALYNVGIIFN